ncbi:hypothetical protein BZA77DRAFT_302027 [Pyronema omphalodes]|nr:hypothetical protein BZA77DRAFT_302027 [Pyronema omphalodes]
MMMMNRRGIVFYDWDILLPFFCWFSNFFCYAICDMRVWVAGFLFLVSFCFCLVIYLTYCIGSFFLGWKKAVDDG